MSVILPVKPGFLFAEWISCQADDLFSIRCISGCFISLLFSFISFLHYLLFISIFRFVHLLAGCLFLFFLFYFSKLPLPVLLAIIFSIIFSSCLTQIDLFVSLLFLPSLVHFVPPLAFSNPARPWVFFVLYFIFPVIWLFGLDPSKLHIFFVIF